MLILDYSLLSLSCSVEFELGKTLKQGVVVVLSEALCLLSTEYVDLFLILPSQRLTDQLGCKVCIHITGMLTQKEHRPRTRATLFMSDSGRHKAEKAAKSTPSDGKKSLSGVTP